MMGTQYGCAQATPEAAVKEFKDAVEAGKATQVIALLPPSYVKDASGLVHEFAGKMDPEIWGKLRTTLGSAAGALGSKASLLVDMSAKDAEEPVSAEVKAVRAKALGEAMGAVAQLMKHDITSLERLKTVDADTFAREISGVFAKSTEAMKSMESDTAAPKPMEFKVLKSEKLENGNVELTFADEDGAEGETEEFKQVEGRWIPAEMADGWADSMKEARDGLKKLDFTTPEGQTNKAQAMMMLGMFEPMIQQIGQAQSAEQLQGMFGSMLMPLMMMGGSMGGGGMGGAPMPMGTAPMAPPAAP
jgi:hypothetical protein